jgi:hypothetical protein
LSALLFVQFSNPEFAICAWVERQRSIAVIVAIFFIVQVFKFDAWNCIVLEQSYGMGTDCHMYNWAESM